MIMQMLNVKANASVLRFNIQHSQFSIYIIPATV